MKELFRIQHKETGHGICDTDANRRLFVKDKETQEELPLDTYMFRHECKKFLWDMLTPREDPCLKVKFHYGYYFGFPSIESLERQLKPEDLAHFKHAGFQIVKIKVKKLVEDYWGKQVMYLPSDVVKKEDVTELIFNKERALAG